MIVTLFFWFPLPRKPPTLHTIGLHKGVRVTLSHWNDTRYDLIQELEMNVPKRSSAPIKNPAITNSTP